MAEDSSQLVYKRPKLSRNSEEEDRLSALPVSLLLHILSFLGTKDVAKTGVLSRKWQYLWTDLAQFDFRNYSKEIDKIRGFVDWVNKTLDICSGNYLKKFGVLFYYRDCFASSVDVWAEFVIRNKVKDVSLHLLSSNNDIYKLPQLMYSNSSMTKLNLRRCDIAPPGSMRWGSLTSLSIAEVELSESVMGVVLSGCPVLEYLELTKCWGLSRLELNTRSLRELVLKSWYTQSFLEIVAPYIQILSMGGNGWALRLIGISSLVKANLDMKWYNLSVDSEANSQTFMIYMKELFESIRHVEEVELGALFFEVCVHALSFIFMSYYCWRRRACNFQNIHFIITCDPAASFDLNCDALQLKTIKFANFGSLYAAGQGQPMLQLVQLLLKRAKILEEMIIDVKEFTRSSSSTRNSSDYLNIAETVRNYPRSSLKAVVRLCS
ncbi:hypothetical protein BUALT_Bualt12G0012000 [Buddleja alternifolia]|uniref:F-box domain-containing protein n=1 Tax=Buddleja alternifolia TaxID=168488 RepID=A0AAV6WYC6_9LAMI|nr:hypothetical protein BUALT_Bualt12G0012000 [Buddleja alternifolia]